MALGLTDNLEKEQELRNEASIPLERKEANFKCKVEQISFCIGGITGSWLDQTLARPPVSYTAESATMGKLTNRRVPFSCCCVQKSSHFKIIIVRL